MNAGKLAVSFPWSGAIDDESSIMERRSRLRLTST